MHTYVQVKFVTGGAICFESATVQRRGTVRYSSPRHVIIPRANFTCNGRITGITASMNRVQSGVSQLFVEVWRPQTPGSDVYNKVDEVQLLESEIIQVGHDLTDSNIYWLVDITLNDDDRIEFKAGDVVGYYQFPDSRYELWSIVTSGYTAYTLSIDASMNASNLTDYSTGTRQPLIQFTIGMAKDS